MGSHIIVQIRLTPPAWESMESLAEKQGMTHLAMLSRLVEWLAHQPATIKASVLSHDSSGSPAAARLIVNQMASARNE